MGISGRKELYLNSKAGRDQEGPNIPAALEQGWLELARELDFPATSCSHRQVRTLLRNKDGSMAPKLYQRQGPTTDLERI
jgi:hypothetical protein